MERVIHISYDKIELAATVHYPAPHTRCDPNKRWPAIIICHGFVGSRIGQNRLFVEAARRFAEEGYFVLRFDYAGCGESGGEYGDNTMESFIAQTRHVLDYVRSIDCVDASRITLLGHSLGGAVARLTANRDSRVSSLILWAPVAHPFYDIVRIVGRDAYEEAEQTGTTDHLGYALRPAFFHSLAHVQPLADTASVFYGDVFVAHGTNDTDIPCDYCGLYRESLRRRAAGRCDTKLIDGADHVFASLAGRRELFSATSDWLAQVEARKSEWSDWTI